MDLCNDVKYIKGVGPSRVQLLNKIGIFTLKDLITYYPRNYEDRSKPQFLCDCVNGEEVTIEAVAFSKISENRIKSNKTMQKLLIKDESGVATVTWFNQTYLKTKFE